MNPLAQPAAHVAPEFAGTEQLKGLPLATAVGWEKHLVVVDVQEPDTLHAPLLHVAETLPVKPLAHWVVQVAPEFTVPQLKGLALAGVDGWVVHCVAVPPVFRHMQGQ